MNVLIVEDDITTTLVLTRSIQEHGHAVVACTTAEQAVELYTPDRFPLIILDLMLPGMDGLAMCRWVRSQPRGDMPYVLVATAKCETSDLLDALAAGANDYLQKSHLAEFLPVRIAVAEKSIAELQRRNTAEEISRTILRTAPDGFWMLDTRGIILSANERLSRILQRSEPDLLHLHHATFLHADDRALAQQRFQETILQGESRFHCRAIRPNGSEIHLEITTKFLDIQGGRIVSFLQDRTEKNRADEQIRQAQKLESIGRLAAGVAHDFNNILTVIQGRAALLEINAVGEDIESIQEIANASQLGGDLTRQLLSFSRKRPAELQPMDLNSSVTGFQKMLRRILGDETFLVTNLLPGLPQTMADKGMIEQVLLNLASNARDAMSRDGTFTIRTSIQSCPHPPQSLDAVHKPGNYICLSATDTGAGIPSEDIPHLFDPFFTTKEQGKGTGLGLAVVSSIVQQHSGWIEVESELKVGTTFKIFLPAVEAPGPATSFNHRNPGSLKMEKGRKTDRVLLVEDDPGVASLANCVLSLQGMQVYTADSGPTALEVWNRQGGKFDLLLTDIMMPGGMNGQDVAEFLRKRDPKLKVLYMSGYNPEIIRLEGNANFLAKPCHPFTLAEAVRKALDAESVN